MRAHNTSTKQGNALKGLLIAAIGAAMSAPILAADLIVDDGVIIKMGPSSQIVVRDGIRLGKSVVITSSKDDTLLGPSGTVAQTPAAGDWRGLKLEASANPVMLDGATIRFGGEASSAALELRKTNRQINYVEVTDSSVGIRLTDSANVTFNGLSLLRNAIGLQATNSTPTLAGSQIQGNGIGIDNLTPTNNIAAAGTWWGSASGPTNAANAGGTGDTVSAGVNFANWATLVPLIDPRVSVPGAPAFTEAANITLELACRNAAEYRVAENGAFTGVAFVPMTRTAPFTLSAGDGIKRISVQYRAATGNLVTAEVAGGLLLDTQGPSLAVTNPANGSYITKSIAIDATATDAGGVSRVEFYIDDVLAGTDSAAPYTYSWNVTNLPDGTHSIRTVAYDAANHSTTDIRSVSLTKAGPPPADVAGPTLTNALAVGNTLADGITLTRSGVVQVNAVDPSGIARIEFLIDAAVFGTDTNGSDGYSAQLNLLPLTDGPHTLTIRGVDSLNNTSMLAANITIALAPPLAPTLSAPTNNAVTNAAQIAVVGRAEAGSQVAIYVNGAVVAVPSAVSTDGSFNIAVPLAEGDNRLQAAAQNRGGTGALTVERIVRRDSSIPATPTGLTASAQASGKVRLTWTRPNDTAIGGYHVYRSAVAFTQIAEASKVNTNLVTGGTYDDLPPVDGTYYYRIVAANTLGTMSAPSNLVSGVADNTMPRATRITYTPSGRFDAATGRMATGRVNVAVKVSEPLLAAPFLTISPVNGIPIAVELIKQTDTDYAGGFDITSTTPVGTAYAVFSARDLVGNRGTEVDVGATVIIDGQGPALTALTVAPGSPIKNDSAAPTTVNVAFTLNEAMKPGELPYLAYVLASAPNQEVAIAGVATAGGLNWQASFNLPPTAGQAQLDTLSFIYRGVDDLDNIATQIAAENRFQIYQGDLPALAVPVNVAATAQAGGAIRLVWGAVPDAAGYQLYRQAPGEAQMTAYQRVGLQTEYLDATPADGLYRYAVASVRQENGQESLSAQSSVAQATADRIPPDAPLNLALTLTGSGIYATWDAPATGGVTAYALYRSSAATITSVAGLTPIKPNLLASPALDAQPSVTDHSYVVTARDAAGNESAISNSVYLNFALLPVSSLVVTQSNNDLPVITWNHTGTSLAGYDVYLGPDDARIKLNSVRLTQKTFTDTGYVQDDRRYTVVAVDTNNVEAPHSILLPKVSAQLIAGTPLKRGLMNRLQYQVTNHSNAPVGQVSLRARVGTRDHVSSGFTLAAGETRTVSMIVGGYSDLLSTTTLATTIEIVPNEGETVRIVRSADVAVQDGAIVTSIATETFTRGATGRVKFTLENTSDVELEVVSATQTGNAASNEMRFKLLDKDNNVLTTQSFKQILGTGVVTLANGRTVIRVAPGARFTSEAVDIPVPASAPELITVQLEIDALHYHSGQADAVKIAGLSNRQGVTLIDTTYMAEVTGVAPAVSFGDQDIVVEGRAVSRATNQPLANAALAVYLRVSGFERKHEVVTDTAGAFRFTYKPQTTDAGVFKISVVHPDLLDRPDYGQFTINSVRIEPTAINLNVPRNYNQEMTIKAIAGDGTVANNVRLVYAAGDQPTGSLTPGVNVSLGAPIALASKQTGSLTATIAADNNAPQTGSFFLTVLSDERGATPIGKIKIDYRFSDAKPMLVATPSYVETGVSQGTNTIERLTLENRGFAAMDNVAVTLTNVDGSAPPAWAYLTTPTQVGSIAVGEKRGIDIAFAPTATVVDGIYSFKLAVSGSNIPTSSVNVYASVTQAGNGNALFKVSDIYTATLDQNGNRIQGLAGARIQVQNEQVITIDHTLVTDSYGEAYIAALPAGRYKFRATAANHQEVIGRFSIKPGLTATQDVFLDYKLVTVEWSVTETTIQDKYEITLTATYETNVPAAVIVLEPASVSLPTLNPGDVFYGEFTLTNYGLIRGDNVKALLPPDDAYFRYEFLNEIPATLNAKQRITLPYRAISLQSFEPSATATGGGCYTYQPHVQVAYDYQCANGTTTSGSSRSAFTYSWGSCQAGTGGGGPVDLIYHGCQHCQSGAGGGDLSSKGGNFPNTPPCKNCKKPKCCKKSGGGPGGD